MAICKICGGEMLEHVLEVPEDNTKESLMKLPAYHFWCREKV